MPEYRYYGTAFKDETEPDGVYRTYRRGLRIITEVPGHDEKWHETKQTFPLSRVGLRAVRITKEHANTLIEVERTRGWFLPADELAATHYYACYMAFLRRPTPVGLFRARFEDGMRIDEAVSSEGWRRTPALRDYRNNRSDEDHIVEVEEGFVFRGIDRWRREEELQGEWPDPPPCPYTFHGLYTPENRPGDGYPITHADTGHPLAHVYRTHHDTGATERIVDDDTWHPATLPHLGAGEGELVELAEEAAYEAIANWSNNGPIHVERPHY